MNIFVLEDNGDRSNAFLTNFVDHYVTICNNASKAIEILTTDDSYDVIFLDHDLGGQVYVSSERDDTGAGVCRNVVFKNKLIAIHSHNHIGARVMKQIIEENKDNSGNQIVIAPFALDEYFNIVQQLLDKH